MILHLSPTYLPLSPVPCVVGALDSGRMILHLSLIPVPFVGALAA